MADCGSRGVCLVDSFKGGAEWPVIKLTGGLPRPETEVCGDILIGGRIGCVSVVDVDVVDGGVPKGRPSEKAGALELSTVVEIWLCLCSEVVTIDMAGVETALRLTSDKSPRNPDGAPCEAAKMEDDGVSTAAAGAGDIDVVAEGLAKGGPKTDVGFLPCSLMLDTIATDIDAPNGEKDIFAFGESRRIDKTSVEPEALGTEVELDQKQKRRKNFVVDQTPPLPPNAELAPKFRFPKTFGIVLIFADAEAAGGTDVESEGVMVSDPAGIEDPKAETGAGAGDVPKTELNDGLVPSMTDGEGLMPQLFVSHSVVLGFSSWGRC